MASPVKIQNFRYGVHLKFLRAFYTRPGINRVNRSSHRTSIYPVFNRLFFDTGHPDRTVWYIGRFVILLALNFLYSMLILMLRYILNLNYLFSIKFHGVMVNIQDFLFGAPILSLDETYFL